MDAATSTTGPHIAGWIDEQQHRGRYSVDMYCCHGSWLLGMYGSDVFRAVLRAMTSRRDWV